MRPILILFLWCVITSNVLGNEEGGFLVRKENRETVVSTENGEIVAARVGDDVDGTSYLLHFITMDPNSLFLPVILHSDMVFYVHTGSGKLSWTEENELKTTDLRRGDVYRLKEGAVFFIRSNLDTEAARQRLRIHAIFAASNTDLHEPPSGPYSSIRELVLGFDKKVLQAAFKVPEEEIEELLSGAKPPAIIHEVSKSYERTRELETEILRLVGGRSYNIFELGKKKGKSSSKSYNIFKEDKDFENCNGWSTTVTRKKLSALKGTNIGVFMVNLTAGSMMGPHWNPMATEIAVVLQGHGMVRVVCSSVSNETGCRNMRFEVGEGDVFAVPRFHPMAQMAFNNGSFVFMGFSSSEKSNHPQFFAGQASVLRTLSTDVMAMSFNVRNTTMEQLLDSQEESVILGCLSCAEEELRILEEEEEREREEEQRRKEEEERRKREEEEARKREEEEERRREEEEEERRREEEEAREREEEERRREEEEEERRREEEEARKREEEEQRRREEEEEERRREEEEEEAREREEEERRREEEERRRKEEAEREEEERQRREEEAARREEEERRRRQEEEERARREEEEAEREEEERQRREEEAARREEEERRRRQEEEERARREEEEAEREEEERERREEEASRREEEERRRRQEKEERARWEEEEAERQEEERQRREASRRAEEERRRRHEEEEERARWEEEEAEREEQERQREEEREREEAAARREEEERRRRQEEEEEEEW